MIKDKAFILSDESICQIHYMLTENELAVNESGHYRNDSVHIIGTSHIPPDAEEVPKHINELLDYYYDQSDTLMTDFERICEFKRNFERIHPFFDGNGRTGRILSNILFLQSGYGYVTIPPEYRVEYFDSIEYNTLHEFLADRMIQSMKYIDELHSTHK